MKFCFISSPTFERWSCDSPNTTGIGGSETSHIEMAQRLARRGHSVESFAPVPWDDGVVNDNAGVPWMLCSEVDFNYPYDVFVLYRDAAVIDRIPAGRTIWLICQDVDYPTLTPARAERCTRIVALCDTHADYLRRQHPTAADRVCVSSNGLKPELVDAVLADPPPRNPRRIMYASSPDRGLWILLYIFERLREVVPDAELHIFYGMQNLEKALAAIPDSWNAEHHREILKMLDMPGVTHHGRVPQPQLAVEWAKSGVWCYPSTWPETSCITSMDAQALGAIPVVKPLWAVGENVQHGTHIHGDPYKDLLVRARYVHELVKLLLRPEDQEAIRREMMPWARNRFTWERFVDQWEDWAYEDAATQAEVTLPYHAPAFEGAFA